MVEMVVMAAPSTAIGVRSCWLRSRIRNWPQHCSSSYDGVMYLLLPDTEREKAAGLDINVGVYQSCLSLSMRLFRHF